MFPTENVHYNKHYNVGYTGVNLNKDTEYRLRFAEKSAPRGAVIDAVAYPREPEGSVDYAYDQNSSREYRTVDTRQADPMKEPVAYEGRMEAAAKMDNGRFMPEHEIKKTEFVPERIEPAHIPRNPSFHASPVDHYMEEVKKEAEPVKVEPEIRLEPVSAAVPEVEVKRELMMAEPERKKSESPPPPSLPTNKASYHEGMERKIRASKYRGYLDLQMELKKEKSEYDKYTRGKDQEMAKLRNTELKRLEKEWYQHERDFKNSLAKDYEKQIAEQKHVTAAKDSSPSTGPVDSFYPTDINQKRYFNVRA